MDDTNMESSQVNVFGSAESPTAVKIIDKSKRAYDISTDSTKGLELSLQKSRTKCKYTCKRLNAWFYALFLLAFKFHGKPPSRSSATYFLLIFSFLLTLDTMLTIVIGFHIYNPMQNWYQFGITFFGIYPLVTVLGPIIGVLGTLCASDRILKFMSSMNATAALINLPLTLACQVYFKDEPFYISAIVLLWFNKFLISYFGAKVRMHLQNPTFTRNTEKIGERY
jgi:hypothetical protein